MNKLGTAFSSYDPFAWIYNRHWGHVFLPIILPILDNLVLGKIPKKARILDLCCGTGQLSQKLNTLGYRVTGIDGSAAMLAYARENAPEVEFIHADASNFILPHKYNAVVSAFDSLNHVIKLKELAEVFHSVHGVLRPGGYFLFDLNTEPGFLHEWQGDFSIIEDDHVCVVRNTYDRERRIADFDATIFRFTGGHWYRTDVTLYQKCHDPTRVKTTLKKAGFADIEVFGFEPESGIRPFTKMMRRAFFFCRKATSSF
ncbi:MAG: class I SAM-dependent methyltransferase [Dehalococcoidia bacterium]|nr:class I SAM-dependent methyltransferase [Dehalococcoidia bacterium]